MILDTLLANPTTVFATVDFYSIIQSDSFDKDFSIDSVKSIIKRLRKKLPEGLVENIYGQGYRLKNLN
ncbi:MAG: helix-turn-helix domain-containing protein [Campylobacterales bacterium]|nr:helix-turn-helix domain-containing protein [Campylobacterales bacterium]